MLLLRVVFQRNRVGKMGGVLGATRNRELAEIGCFYLLRLFSSIVIFFVIASRRRSNLDCFTALQFAMTSFIIRATTLAIIATIRPAVQINGCGAFFAFVVVGNTFSSIELVWAFQSTGWAALQTVGTIATREF